MKKLLVIAVTGLAILVGPSALAATMGGPGPDDIRGTAGADVLSGGGGNDDIRGRAGDDVIYTGSGSDSVYGGRGFDVCYVQVPDLFSGCEVVR
ncbi:MAG: hypothetical protein ACRDIC_06065 [bacterium]